MSAAQRLWLQQAATPLSPKLMYPRLLGRRAAAAKGSAAGGKGESPAASSSRLARLVGSMAGSTGDCGARCQGHAAGRLTPAAGDQEEFEYSEPRADLEGLVGYLEWLRREGVQLTEVTYIVNAWSLGGVIPLRHHGFIVRAGDSGFFTLDFSKRGILWDTFDAYPDLPEGTVSVERYRINADPFVLEIYCRETKPFSWPGNDCAQWSRGAMEVLGGQEQTWEGVRPKTLPSCTDKMYALLCSGLEHPAFTGCFS